MLAGNVVTFWDNTNSQAYIAEVAKSGPGEPQSSDSTLTKTHLRVAF